MINSFLEHSQPQRRPTPEEMNSSVDSEMFQDVLSEIKETFSDLDEASPESIPQAYVNLKKWSITMANKVLDEDQQLDENVTREALLPEYKQDRKRELIKSMSERYAVVPQGISTIITALISEMPHAALKGEYHQYIWDAACFASHENIERWEEEFYEGDDDFYRLQDFRNAVAEFHQVYQTLESNHLLRETATPAGLLSKKLLDERLSESDFANQFFTAALESEEPMKSVQILFDEVRERLGTKATEYIYESLMLKRRVLEGELSARLTEIAHSTDMSMEDKQEQKKRIVDLVEFLYSFISGQTHYVLGNEYYQRIHKLIDSLFGNDPQLTSF